MHLSGTVCIACFTTEITSFFKLVVPVKVYALKPKNKGLSEAKKLLWQRLVVAIKPHLHLLASPAVANNPAK